MHKKFEINQTKIKGGCQLGRKVVPHNSKSNLPLVYSSPGRRGFFSRAGGTIVGRATLINKDTILRHYHDSLSPSSAFAQQKPVKSLVPTWSRNTKILLVYILTVAGAS